MSKLRYGLLTLACAGVLAAAATLAFGTNAASGGPKHHHGPPFSKDVRQMLNDVSSRNVQATIEELVAFGTRHTLSSQTDPNRGIGAARDWLFDQYQADRRDLRRADDGREAVLRQQPGARIPTPTRSPT